MRLIEAFGLKKSYSSREGSQARHVAVDDVSLTIEKGESVALVGETGSGKSTLGRMVAGLLAPDEGAVRLAGVDLYTLSRAEQRRIRRRIQWIPQMPSSTLNPRYTVYQTLDEVLVTHYPSLPRAERGRRIERTLRGVGLDGVRISRRTGALSIGQQQRLAICRALILEPDFVICDEITSGLDGCLELQVLELLKAIRASTEVAYLFITHNLSITPFLCDRLIVFRNGRIVEEGELQELVKTPKKDYSKKLMRAAFAHLPNTGPQPSKP